MRRDVHVLMLPSWYPTHYDRIGGSFFLQQAMALKQVGARVGVIYPDLRSIRTLMCGRISAQRFNVSVYSDNGVPHIIANAWNIPKMRRVNAWIWEIYAVRLYRIYVQAFGQPDVIHAQSVLWGGVAAARISRESNRPYVVTEHSSAFGRGLIRPWERKSVREGFTRAARVMAVSSHLLREIQEFIPSVSRVSVIPNVIDTEYWVRSIEKPQDGILRILCVAHLDANKGVDYLLRAFRLVIDEYPELRLAVVGEGPERRRLVRLATKLGVSSKITFRGGITRDGVRTSMDNADVVVLPSRYETFGVVLIEAMSMGIPVVATACGGPEDFVTEKVGYLVPCNNVSALRDALKAFIIGRDSWARKAKAIREYAISRFSCDAVGKRLIAEYNEIL